MEHTGIKTVGETLSQYDEAALGCREIFLAKTADYGTSWRVYRTISVADQIYIKAMRIRTIQEKKVQKVGDDIRTEFRGIFNYAIIGLIQLELGEEGASELDTASVAVLYDTQVAKAKALMQDKNHDYGEAWREMSQESFADLILSKVLRIRSIVRNDGQTTVSEGIGANYFDIMNYALFALILIGEGQHAT
jgi:hypothetical protein